MFCRVATLWIQVVRPVCFSDFSRFLFGNTCSSWCAKALAALASAVPFVQHSVPYASLSARITRITRTSPKRFQTRHSNILILDTSNTSDCQDTYGKLGLAVEGMVRVAFELVRQSAGASKASKTNFPRFRLQTSPSPWLKVGKDGDGEIEYNWARRSRLMWLWCLETVWIQIEVQLSIVDWWYKLRTNDIEHKTKYFARQLQRGELGARSTRKSVGVFNWWSWFKSCFDLHCDPAEMNQLSWIVIDKSCVLVYWFLES